MQRPEKGQSPDCGRGDWDPDSGREYRNPDYGRDNRDPISGREDRDPDPGRDDRDPVSSLRAVSGLCVFMGLDQAAERLYFCQQQEG